MGAYLIFYLVEGALAKQDTIFAGSSADLFFLLLLLTKQTIEYQCFHRISLCQRQL